MLFWTLTAALVALVALLFVLALVRRSADAPPAEAFDLQVYRDQLRDLERDIARGVIGAEEGERTRVEISRRMLEADRAAKTAAVAGRAPGWATAGAVIALGAVMGGSFLLYQRLGSADYPDQPLRDRIAMANELYDNRPSQEEAEKQAEANAGPKPAPDAQFAELMERLRKAVEARPNEVQGLELLARNEMGMGNFRAGWQAQEKLIGAKGAAASADDYAQLGEYLVVAAGGLVTKEAETAFATALDLNAQHKLSRYYIGLMMAQNGRPDRAFRIWDALLRDSAPGDPWVAPISQNIEQLAWIAGETRYTPPMVGGRGPSEADMAAAAQMSPEERQQMIRSMVEGLNDRLAAEGGPAQDWAKLISSLRMLGEEDRAAAIAAEAETRFKDFPEDLAKIRAAATGEVAPMADPMMGAPAMGDAPEGTPMRGPALSDEQMKSAAEMSPEERAQMIEGMVNGLVERLESQGGSGAEWARAVSSLAALGRAEAAAAVYAKAQSALAGQEAELAPVTEAAQAAGLAQ